MTNNLARGVDVDESTHKTCVRCELVKSRAEFHRRSVAHDGLNAACKECICEERRRYTAEYPDRIAEARKRYDADPEKRARNLARMAKWRTENPEHRAAYSEQHYAANRKRYAAWKQAWYEANRAEILARQAADIDGKTTAKLQRYRERNREVLAERSRRRQAVYKAGAQAGPVDLDALWTGFCGICGMELDRAAIAPDLMRKSLDHIFPISRGGDHVQENLQWTHLACNVSKGARLPD